MITPTQPLSDYIWGTLEPSADLALDVAELRLDALEGALDVVKIARQASLILPERLVEIAAELLDELLGGGHGRPLSSVVGASEGSDVAGSSSPDSATSCHCGGVDLTLVDQAIFSDARGAVLHGGTECFAVSDLSYGRFKLVTL